MRTIPDQLAQRLHFLVDPDASTLVKTNVLLSLMAWSDILPSQGWQDTARLHFARCFDHELEKTGKSSAATFAETFLQEDIQALFAATNISSLSDLLDNVWSWDQVCEQYVRDDDRIGTLREIADIYFCLKCTPEAKSTFEHAFRIYEAALGKRGVVSSTWNNLKGKWGAKIVVHWAFWQADIISFDYFSGFGELSKEDRRLLENGMSFNDPELFRELPLDMYSPEFEECVVDEQVHEMLALINWAAPLWDNTLTQREFFKGFKPPILEDESLLPHPIPKEEWQPT